LMRNSPLETSTWAAVAIEQHMDGPADHSRSTSPRMVPDRRPASLHDSRRGVPARSACGEGFADAVDGYGVAARIERTEVDRPLVGRGNLGADLIGWSLSDDADGDGRA